MPQMISPYSAKLGSSQGLVLVSKFFEKKERMDCPFKGLVFGG
jgi:hypothetical protein